MASGGSRTPRQTGDPISDSLYRLGNWWRRTLKPVLGGLFGGFALAVAAACILEPLGIAAHTPAFDNAVCLTWLSGSFGIYWLMSRAALGKERDHGRERVRQAQAAGRLTPEQAVSSQVQRIVLKSRRLQQGARKARGPYTSLADSARELELQARALCDRYATLRRAAAEIGHEAMVSPSPDEQDAGLQHEYQAATAAQERLEQAVADNHAQQRLCLTRLERIEDLLDTAWLEVSQAPTTPVAAATGPAIVQQVEAELTAAQEAVDEVERVQRQEQELTP